MVLISTLTFLNPNRNPASAKVHAPREAYKRVRRAARAIRKTAGARAPARRLNARTPVREVHVIPT